MNNRTLLISACLATLLLSACGSLSQLQRLGLYEVHATEREVSEPAIGIQTTVSVGSSIISFSRELRSDYLIIETPLEIDQKWGEDDSYRISIPTGAFKLKFKDSHGNSYFPVGTLTQTWFEKGKPDGTDPVLVDYRVASNGTISVIWAEEREDDFEEPNIRPPKYSIKMGAAEAAPSSFRRELIYTGRSGSTLTLLYREFLNDMARPAFSQQLQYDISNDAIIGYQGARFHVVSADNTAITYKSLSHLSSK